MTHRVEEKLCLACGFCCDGTLFTRVRLQPDESVESLKSAELRILKNAQGQWIMEQPCSGYSQGQCQTYHCRPVRCGTFRCTLLKNVETGIDSEETALNMIRDTKRTRDQLTLELVKIFPGFQGKSMAENLRRLKKEGRKLAGERLKLFRTARKKITQLKTLLSSQLDTHFYVTEAAPTDQTQSTTTDRHEVK